MLRFVCLAFFLAVMSSVATAGLIIDIQDATIAADGSGFVDVLISSSSRVKLDFAAYEFEISRVGGPVSRLEFTDPQVTEVGLPDYVFAGNAAPIGVFELTSSRFVAIAASEDILGIELPAAVPRLLARLELQSVLGPGHTPALVNGEQFRISLLDSGDTLFGNRDGYLAIDPSSFTNSGLITIQDVTAVPEPSSLGLCAIGAAAMVYRKLRWRSKTQSRERLSAGTLN